LNNKINQAVKVGIAKRILVVWFSFLLFLGNTPMDFVHLFANHQDTVHRGHKGLVIEKKHHHCAYLSLTLTSFINDFQAPCAFYTSCVFHVQHSTAGVSFVQRFLLAASLRGPPMV
jgi:hypothetical protein